MKRSILAFSIAATFAAASSVNAVPIPTGSVFSIGAGSKFNMGGSFNYPESCAGAGGAITGQKGIFVGPNMGNFGTGSHGGFPTPNDVGSVTKQWGYFSNTGVDFMSQVYGNDFSADTNGTVDMSAWTVSWNGIPEIPMGLVSVVSTLYCGTDCSDGDTYTISHSATVPASPPTGFGGVSYDVCLKGTITYPGSLPADTPPVATDDIYALPSGVTGVILGITRNDIEDKVDDAIDKSTIDLDPATPGQQTVFVTPVLGNTITLTGSTVTFDAGVTGTESFTYTVDDFRGPTTSNVATVTVSTGNLPPVCNDDGLAQGAFVEVNTNPSVTIDVVANDTDPNGGDNFDFATLNITSGPSNGMLMDNGDGTVTYTFTPGFQGPSDSFTYNISDDSADPAPLACADATVNIVVSNAGAPIGNSANGFLVIDTGVVGTDNKLQPALGEGSWFTMELSPGSYTHTAIAGFNHIQLGTTQPGLSPAGPNIDSPWRFFGNLGVHQTTSDVIQLSNLDGVGTLNFSGWDVSWNGIPSIPMGVGALDPADNSIAALECYNTEADFLAGTPTVGTGLNPNTGNNYNSCDDGDLFVLTYSATVPEGDKSGFGGVRYAFHFEGVISDTAPIVGCADDETPDVTFVSAIGDCATKSAMVMEPGETAISVGNSTGLYLAAAHIGVTDPVINPNSGQQCIGGCLDFVFNNVPAGGEVNFVVKLTEDIPAGAVYRKLVNGKWQDFDTSGNDAIGSTSVDATSGNCVGPKGTFSIGLRAGSRCLFMKITDGGPNDADGIANGTIVDPSGIALTGASNAPASSSDGCSISKTPVNLTERADWMIVAGFISLMGLMAFKRRRQPVSRRGNR